MADCRRQIMDYLGIVVVCLALYTGLMGWLGNRR
jgi:hypothetical protein